MAGSLPNFVLFGCVDASGGVPLRIAPNGFDFNKNEGCSVAGDDVEFATAVGVIAGEDLVAFAHEVCGGMRLDKVALRLVV